MSGCRSWKRSTLDFPRCSCGRGEPGNDAGGLAVSAYVLAVSASVVDASAEQLGAGEDRFWLPLRPAKNKPIGWHCLLAVASCTLLLSTMPKMQGQTATANRIFKSRFTLLHIYVYDYVIFDCVLDPLLYVLHGIL